jgi:hypothetical protein
MSTEERLARLERSQRWLRFANVALVGTVLALAVPCCTARKDNALPTAAASSAESVPEVIRARSFEVVNHGGQAVLSVGITSDGNGAIRVKNLDAREVVHIVASKDGGAIAVSSSNGESSLLVGTSGDMAAIEFCANAKGEAVVTILASELGGGALQVCNPLGSEVATIQSDKMNCGLVSVSDANGKVKNGISGSR